MNKLFIIMVNGCFFTNKSVEAEGDGYLPLLDWTNVSFEIKNARMFNTKEAPKMLLPRLRTLFPGQKVGVHEISIMLGDEV